MVVEQSIRPWYANIKQRHQELDIEIVRLSEKLGDDTEISRLNKRKLKLKENG